jgi:HEAT repeat protein
VAALLADHDWQVRSAARQGLEAIGPQVEPVLIQALSHADPFARNGAAEVLQNLGLLPALVRTYIRSESVFAKTAMRRLEDAAGPRIWKNVLDDLAA